MATTREKAEAYAYANRRQATSLIRGTDEALSDPRQRLNRSLAGGIAIGVLILAVFGVIGWLGGGRGPGLPDSGAVVVAGSGNQYVVLNGVVHEALNLSSALLVGGGPVIEVRARALEGTPRGLPVGIPGAPDALPTATNLTGEPWTICAVPSESTVVEPRVRLYIGLPAPAGALSDGDGVLLRSPDDQVWLVAEGRRYALPGQTQAMLGKQRDNPVPLPAEIIATIPEGPEITVPDIVDRSLPPAVAVPGGAVIGDVFTSGADGVDQRYSVVQRDGVSPISELTYTLLVADGSTLRTAGPGELAGPAQVSSAPGNPAWPDAVPQVQQLQRDQPLCVSTRPGDSPGNAPWRVSLQTPDALPQPAGIRPLMSGNGGLPGLLEAVLIPSGSGALVRSATSAGEDGAYTLITDSGQRYLIVSADAVSRLGYDPAAAPGIPAPFVDPLPPGPDLDPTEASVERTGTR